MSPAPAWVPVADGLMVTVRATPRGGRDAIDGQIELSDGRAALKARVAVAAEDGKANDALARLLARAAGIAPSQVELISGATSRIKSFRLKGDARQITARLTAVIGD